MRTELVFERKISCNLGFKMELGFVCSKEAYSAEFKKQMYLSKANHLG
jgi:hypothetical protein